MSVPTQTCRVVTIDFPVGGQDGWVMLAEGTDRRNTDYDRREAVNEYIEWEKDEIGTTDHEVEGRIIHVP